MCYCRKGKLDSANTCCVRAALGSLLVTVWVVQQMRHSEEGVIENRGGNSPVLSIYQQHALQQGHKLPPVRLVCLHVTVVRTQHQVHLMDGSTGGGGHAACENHTGTSADILNTRFSMDVIIRTLI